MNHVNEEQLILHYYGEQTDGIEEHLSACAECREELRRLQLVLNTVTTADVPERGPEYGGMVWNRLKLKHGRRGISSWRKFLPWMLVPGVAALLVLAFFAGRRFPSERAPVAAASTLRERILLVAVGDHLDRSQLVLAELTHATPEKGKTDISDEQKAAEDLLDSNRLYRRAALRSGDAAVATVLDDLERVLAEIANSPSEVSAEHLAELQQRIRDQGLLFKVRVLDSQVRQRQRPPQPDTKQYTTKL